MKFQELLDKYSGTGLKQAVLECLGGERNNPEAHFHVIEQLRLLTPRPSDLCIFVKRCTETPIDWDLLKARYDELCKKPRDEWSDLDKLFHPEDEVFDDAYIAARKAEDAAAVPEVYYDVHGRRPDSPESWSVSYTDWAEWLSMEVDQASIDALGIDLFLAACIDDMTWNGWDYDECQANNKAMMESLRRDIDEFEEGREVDDA